jgi:apolipoprotein N-acyltransferase
MECQGSAESLPQGWPLWKRALLCLGSCVLLGLSFPKADIGLVAWVSLVPLAWSLRGASAKEAAVCGGIFGFVLTFVLLYFIGLFGFLPLVLLAIYQAAFFAILGVVWSVFLSRGGAAAVLGPAAVWAGLEWARSLGPLGHTFGALGYTQHAILPVAQVARIGAVYAVSFVVVAVNVGIAEAIWPRTGKRQETPGAGALSAASKVEALIPGALLLLSMGYGWMVMGLAAGDGAPVLRVAAIQPNPRLSFYSSTPAERRTDLRQHVQMTVALQGWQPDLIAWPETAITGSLFAGETFRDVVRAARDSGADLLVGSTERGPDAVLGQPGKIFNRAWMISSDGKILGYYDKVKLVLFGEYVPFRQALGFILKRYPIRSFDYSPGEGIVVFGMEKYTLGVAICFEELQPTMLRDACRQGADVLAVITNDGWFKKTSAAKHLADICVFRAIENGAPLVRAAKTGISCIIDKCGRVLDTSGVFVEAQVKAPVSLRSGATPYQVVGDLFAILCLIGAGAGLGLCVVKPDWGLRLPCFRRNADSQRRLPLFGDRGKWLPWRKGGGSR